MMYCRGGGIGKGWEVGWGGGPLPSSFLIPGNGMTLIMLRSATIFVPKRKINISLRKASKLEKKSKRFWTNKK